MHKLKSALVWALFALCLITAFGFGYFVRGTAEADAQTSATVQTTATAQTTDIANTAATSKSTAASQTTTPTTKPQQTSSTAEKTTAQTTSPVVITYILNTDSKKIHYPTCASAKRIAEENRGSHTGDYTGLLAQGYTTCGTCFK